MTTPLDLAAHDLVRVVDPARLAHAIDQQLAAANQRRQDRAQTDLTALAPTLQLTSDDRSAVQTGKVDLAARGLDASSVDRSVQLGSRDQSTVKIERDGVPVDQSAIRRSSLSGHDAIDGLGILRAVRTGHTVQLLHTERVEPGPFALAATASAALGVPCFTHMFVAHGTGAGAGVHFDNPEVVAIQASGRRRWRIWRPDPPHPRRPVSAEAGELVFEGVLEPGDAVRVPAGHLHEVSGVGELAAHYSLTIAWRTGVHLVAHAESILNLTNDAVRAPLHEGLLDSLDVADPSMRDSLAAFTRAALVPDRSDRLTQVEAALSGKAPLRLACPGGVMRVPHADSEGHTAIALGAVGVRLADEDLTAFATIADGAEFQRSPSDVPTNADGLDRLLGLLGSRGLLSLGTAPAI